MSKCGCKSGCVCIAGYLRNSKGICVAPENCDTCKANEIFSKCGNTGCQNNCDEPNRLASCSLPAGTCNPGCICQDGYLRTFKGDCVPENECIKRCPNENEMYNICGSACPESCDTLSQNVTCTDQCVPGCFCTPGTVRNSEGRCILIEECPKTCSKPFEVYKTCGTACPKTCENKDVNVQCIEVCVEGCFCEDTHVRDSEGNCVLPENCPLKCGPNEDLDTCANCPKGAICIVPCTQACVCKPGFVKDKNNICVEKKEPLKCGKNEVLNPCINPCPPGAQCFAPCIAACECKPGFKKDAKNVCVNTKYT